MPRFTPQEQRMLDVLGDGMVHTVEELKGCLWDEMTTDPVNCISQTVHHLKKKLVPMGQYIIFDTHSGHVRGYRQVRMVDLHAE